jgi:hypothetical protein
MSYCVWTLSDNTGVRFVGTGPSDDPLLSFKKVERTGVLRTGLGDWLDSLDTPPKFAVMLADVSAREADRASEKMIARLPNLLNRGRGTRGGKGKRVVMIFKNGRVRWFPSQSAACRCLGVKWSGIDLTGQAIRRRQRPGTAGRKPASHAAAVRPEPASHAAAVRVDAEAAAARPEPRAAEKKPQKPRKKRPNAHFLGVLCFRDDHFGGISERIPADSTADAAN